MIIEITDVWCPDLKPPTFGQPEDTLNFKVLIQITLAERINSGSETFELMVCSPNKLAETEPGLFINNTLVIEKFDWDVIKNRISKLLCFCQGSSSWREVILKLSGYLKYSDDEIWNL